jgi:adenylate cyclase
MARRALELDADDPTVLTMAGAAEIMLGGDLDAAALHVAKAVALDPNSAWAWIRSGYVNTWLGEHAIALDHFERAGRLSPFDQLEFNRCVGLALVHFAAGRLGEAIACAGRARLARPGLLYAGLILAAAHAGAGDEARARQEGRELLALYPGISLAAVMQTVRFRDERIRERFADGLRRAGIT